MPRTIKPASLRAGVPAPFVVALLLLIALQLLVVVWIVSRPPPTAAVVERPSPCVPAPGIDRPGVVPCLEPIVERQA